MSWATSRLSGGSGMAPRLAQSRRDGADRGGRARSVAQDAEDLDLSRCRTAPAASCSCRARTRARQGPSAAEARIGLSARPHDRLGR